MSKSKKFFALIFSVLMLFLLENSNAFALTVSISNSSHTLTEIPTYNESYLKDYKMYLNSNENFSVSFTATDVKGNLLWRIPAPYSMSKISSYAQFSSSGNSAVFTGKMPQNLKEIEIAVNAEDCDTDGNLIGETNSFFKCYITIINQNYSDQENDNNNEENETTEDNDTDNEQENYEDTTGDNTDSNTKIVPNFDFDYYEDEYPVIVISAGTDFSYSVTVQNPDTSKGSVYWRAWYGTESIHADKPDYFEGEGNTFTVSKTMPTNAASRYYVAIVLYYLTDTGLTDSGVRLNLYVDTDNTRKENARLHVAIVEEVPEEYKTDDLLQKLANNVSTDRNYIQWLPADAIDTSEPPEPTQAMRDQVAKDRYQFMAKLNTIKVSDDGYYAFMVTVSDDLVGTKVSDLKLYYAEDSEFTTSSTDDVRLAFGLMPIINGVTGAIEVSDFFGVKLDTLPKQFLATMFLSASKSMTVYIVKILLAILGVGCVVGGSGLALAVGGFFVWKFYKRHS